MKLRSWVLGVGSIVLVSTVTLAICEIGFRVLLFSNVEFMKRFRSADLYSSYDSEDNYWKLYFLFGGEFRPPESPHPKLGWVGQFDRDTFLHNEATHVGMKKPVLLYGDSFAACSTLQNKQECFEGFFNNDPQLSQRYDLLNYGVGGYGVDQIFLLFRESLKHYQDPFVIIGIMTWDFDRSVLSVRIGQKPYYEVEEEELKLKGVPVSQDSNEFFREHPPQIWSYLYRLWAVNGDRFWRVRQALLGVEKRQRKVAEVNEKILNEMIAELNRRGLQHLFVIFYPNWTYRESPDWREVLIKRVLSENGERYLSTKELVSEDAKRLGKNPLEYYDATGHPTAYQNRLITNHIKPYVVSGGEREIGK